MQDGNQTVRLCLFDGAAEVEHAGMQIQTVGGNFDPPKPVRARRVEHDFFVDQQLVMERQVVTVSVEPVGIKRINRQILAHPSNDFLAG